MVSADETVAGEYAMGWTGDTATGEYVVGLSESDELCTCPYMLTDCVSSMKRSPPIP